MTTMNATTVGTRWAWRGSVWTVLAVVRTRVVVADDAHRATVGVCYWLEQVELGAATLVGFEAVRS